MNYTYKLSPTTASSQKLHTTWISFIIVSPFIYRGFSCVVLFEMTIPACVRHVIKLGRYVFGRYIIGTIEDNFSGGKKSEPWMDICLVHGYYYLLGKFERILLSVKTHLRIMRLLWDEKCLFVCLLFVSRVREISREMSGGNNIASDDSGKLSVERWWWWNMMRHLYAVGQSCDTSTLHAISFFASFIAIMTGGERRSSMIMSD